MKTVGNGIGFSDGMNDDQKTHMKYRLIQHIKEQISRIQLFDLHHVSKEKRRFSKTRVK